MALEWIEKLGYTHGDITIRNIGIDWNKQLKLFDFGSVMHRDEDNFYNQVLEDHFNLANCLHFQHLELTLLLVQRASRTSDKF